MRESNNLRKIAPGETDLGSELDFSKRLRLAAVRTLEIGDCDVVGHIVRVVEFGHIEFTIVVFTRHLEVSSIDAFSGFYVDTLGFEVQTTVPAASFVSAGGYHHHIGANTWHHRTSPVSGRGLSWFEVILPERESLNTVRERVATREIPFTETDDGLVVHDPDEIEIRIRIAPSNQ